MPAVQAFAIGIIFNLIVGLVESFAYVIYDGNVRLTPYDSRPPLQKIASLQIRVPRVPSVYIAGYALNAQNNTPSGLCVFKRGRELHVEPVPRVLLRCPSRSPHVTIIKPSIRRVPGYPSGYPQCVRRWMFDRPWAP